MVGRIVAVACGLVFLVAVSMVGTSEAFDPESVVAYWLFDEGRGNEAIDLSGNGHDGELSAGIDWVEGQFGEALEFTRTGVVVVSHDDQLTLTKYTLMAWVNLSGNSQLIVGKDSWPNRNYYMGLHSEGQLHHAFNVPEVPGGTWFDTPTSVSDGDWHHVAVTYDKVKAKSYIDSELDAEIDFTFDLPQNELDVEIGRRVVGIIDEVLIANQAFSEDEIKRAMELGLEQFMLGMAVSAPDKLVSTWGFLKN